MIRACVFLFVGLRHADPLGTGLASASGLRDHVLEASEELLAVAANA